MNEINDEIPPQQDVLYTLVFNSVDHFDPNALSEAIKVGSDFYPKHCATHGVVRHCVKTHRCAHCWSVRRMAKKAGHAEYFSECLRCGVTPFGVQSGRCLRCFNTVGVLRPHLRGGVTRRRDARAQARAEGAAFYEDHCVTHGLHKFGVRYGKCLGCFTFEGRPRKGIDT